MPSDKLPPNVYRLSQRRFDAIPGSPWTYWVTEQIRHVFTESAGLKGIAEVKLGLSAVDVGRFNRNWWEVTDAHRWHLLMKGGGFQRWYAYNDTCTNWHENGLEVKHEVTHRYPYLRGNYGLKIRNMDWVGKSGLTYTNIAGERFSARIMPSGALFDDTGPAIFPRHIASLHLLGLLNSCLATYVLMLINPSIHFQKGDVEKLPIPAVAVESQLPEHVQHAVLVTASQATTYENTFSLIAPPRWDTGLDNMVEAQARLAKWERQIDDEVYRLYGISTEDRAAIEAELAGGAEVAAEETEESAAPATEEAPAAAMTSQELAVRWISYAVGIVLGRFWPGGSPPIPPTLGGDTLPPSIGGSGGPHDSVPPSIGGLGGPLGSAIYRRSDFAVGSLPAPDEAEFDQLVGTPDRFAYVDADGGRHLFGAQVEAALRDLAVPDGITVLDEGHPRDLAALVEKALDLMLGDKGKQEVVNEGAGGDLRGFLSGDFFRRWHLKWYRKRPVYWPLQSARRSYGFVVFHEKVERSFLYTLQRDYLDYKRNGLTLEIGDLSKRLAAQTGAQRRSAERQIDDARKTLDELDEFAKTLARIAGEGYEPAPDWIDDGVILRLAPLWEALPLWKTEPKKYWEALQNGEYDWSHIAMKYWPDRVRQKCTTNKSFAIAHGHEEWYGGA